MSEKKLSSFSVAPALGSIDFFVGLINNGDGTYNNCRFTLAQIAAGIGSAGRSIITAGSGGYTISGSGSVTLAGSFFANPITTIITGGPTYIINVDFTQNIGASSITWINGSGWTNGQVLIAVI